MLCKNTFLYDAGWFQGTNTVHLQAVAHKVLALASYGQDKLAESAQLSAAAESNAVQWCTYFL